MKIRVGGGPHTISLPPGKSTVIRNTPALTPPQFGGFSDGASDAV
jgi:hypothetical protein